jgi:plasmid stabilization system protein ParE
VSNHLLIVVDSRAEADLDTAADWYAEQRLELALELLNAVDAAFEFISQFPQAGQEVMPGVRSCKG